MDRSAPALSVVLLVGPHRERSSRALRSLLDQSIVDQMEVLVLDPEVENHPPLPGSDHPAVKTIACEMRESWGKIRADAVRIAQAPIVAFLEDHAYVFPGWAEANLRAFEGPWAGVGGEVHNANPHIGISDALVFTYFLPFFAPARRGEVKRIMGHNSAYRRDILLGYGDRLDYMLLVEYTLNIALLADGHQLLLEPGIKIAHQNETSLFSIIKGDYFSNRCFGNLRASLFGWPFWKRFLYVLLTPLIPWRRLFRIVVSIIFDRRDLLLPLLRSLPVIAVADHVAAVGMTVGLLFGIGQADINFRIYIVSEPRAG